MLYYVLGLKNARQGRGMGAFRKSPCTSAHLSTRTLDSSGGDRTALRPHLSSRCLRQSYSTDCNQMAPVSGQNLQEAMECLLEDRRPQDRDLQLLDLASCWPSAPHG